MLFREQATDTFGSGNIKEHFVRLHNQGNEERGLAAQD
jgi:hypothetical protein